MKKSITILSFLLSVVAFGQTNLTELYRMAYGDFRAANFEEAVKKYTKVIEIVDSESVKKSCHINRGLSYDRLQKYDLAIQDFTEAIKLDSTDMASFIDRGISNMHAGYLEKAKKDFNHVVAEKKDSRMMESALYWLARIHYSEGKYKEVIKNCDMYFKIYPNDPEIHFIRGTANDMLQNFNESIADYDKAIEIKPKYVQAIANRGTAKINLLTTNGNLQPSKKETESACKDLKKAKWLGDTSVEDLIFVYCNKK